MLFSEFISEWQRDCRGEVSGGWKLTQDQMVRDYVLPKLGDKKIRQIQPIDILRTLNHMQDAGRAAQTRLHVFNLLKEIFKKANSLHRLNIKTPVLDDFRPKLVHKEPLFLVPEHGYMLLAHVLEKRFELAVFINLLCGNRVGEIQALRWENGIDWKNEELKVFQHYCRKTKKIIPRTKNGKEVRVPIPPLLMERLIRHKRSSGFITGDGEKKMCQVQFHKFLKRNCAELQIPLISSHGLRHSCGEIWYEKGATIEDLRRLLNHSSEKSTMRYIHRTSHRLKILSLQLTNLQKIS